MIQCDLAMDLISQFCHQICERYSKCLSHYLYIWFEIVDKCGKFLSSIVLISQWVAVKPRVYCHRDFTVNIVVTHKGTLESL